MSKFVNYMNCVNCAKNIFTQFTKDIQKDFAKIAPQRICLITIIESYKIIVFQNSITMINPLTELNIKISPLGSELDLNWLLPEVLPTNYKIYIFKQNGTDVSDVKIQDYFDNIADLSAFDYEGMFVFDKITNNITIITDYIVNNGNHYYYKGVVRDEDSGEYSTALSVNAIPDYDFLTEILDGKSIVAKALEVMLTTLKSKTGTRLSLKKDIKIIKNYSLEPPAQDLIMVERVNGSTYQSFWGNYFLAYSNQIILGDLETDVIRITYLTEAGPERRDEITNVIRARKQQLKAMCKKLGAKDCTISIEGDYYNPQFHGVNALGITVVFSLLIENKVKFELPAITEHIPIIDVSN